MSKLSCGGITRMKCMHCGLPLSPTRIQVNCPRCGKATMPSQDSTEISGPQDLIPMRQMGYAYSEQALSSSAGDLQVSPQIQSIGLEQGVVHTQPPAANTTTWEP